MVNRLIRWAFSLAAIGGLVMLLAGTYRNPWLWAYVGVLAATTLYAVFCMNEEVARERFKPPEPGADKVALRFLRFLALAHVVVGALDVGRWQIALVPPAWRVVGLVGMALGFLLVFRAMRENRFFSPVVRVQRESGHHVIASGPYAIVRHPGYAGMALGVPLSGIALGSWLGAALALAYGAMIVRRVTFEDRFLQQSLEGYRAYTQTVPYRLVPGVW